MFKDKYGNTLHEGDNVEWIGSNENPCKDFHGLTAKGKVHIIQGLMVIETQDNELLRVNGKLVAFECDGEPCYEITKI